MTQVIGLTGGIATGKSTADNFFAKKDIPIIDADKISHNILNINKPAWKQLRQIFGIEYLNEDQTVNRQKLGELVFNNSEKLHLLNQITHPYIYQEITEQINLARKDRVPIVIVDAPVLFESGGQKYCDQIIVISLPEKIQIKRLMERNNLTKKQAIARIHSQMSLREKESKATFVVTNIGTIMELENKLEKILQKIKRGV